MTDTNQASELYELCKDVYKRTGWEDTRDFYHEKDTFDEETQTFKRNGIFSIVERKRADYNTPLYTSDYLLEKLLPITSIQLKRKANGDIRLFYFPEKPDYATYDYDTPLKCLLALTIALSEAEQICQVETITTKQKEERNGKKPMKILNLYAGVGGNRKLWGDEHEVTAVENEQYIADVYKELHPNDKVVVADAHQYLLDHYKEFDFIWASPPCPSHSRIRLTHKTKSTKPVYPDMQLYEEIIFLKHMYDGDWVVENVIPYYKPLIAPTVILDRHCIWSNKPIQEKEFNRGYSVDLTRQVGSRDTLTVAYGIQLPEGTKNQRKLLRNMVLPEMGNYVLEEIKK